MTDLRDLLPDDQILPQSLWPWPCETYDDLTVYNEFREAYLANDADLLEHWQQYERYNSLVGNVRNSLRALAYGTVPMRRWQIGCACCTPSSDSTSAPCALCTGGAPSTVSLTVSHITNDDCDCSFFNTTFDLPYIGETDGMCVWQYEDTWMCNGEEVPYVVTVSLMENISNDIILTGSLLIGSEDGLRPETVHWQGDVNLGSGSTIDCSATYQLTEWSLVEYYPPKYCWADSTNNCPDLVINA